MPKKTSKKCVLDERLPFEHYDRMCKQLAETALVGVVEHLAKGCIDYRNLVKPINSKRCDAIAKSIPFARVNNEEESIIVEARVDEIDYTRNGAVVLIDVTVDNRLEGNIERLTSTQVLTKSKFNGGNDMLVASFVDRVVYVMTKVMHGYFNDALFKSGRAPSREEVYEGEEE